MSKAMSGALAADLSLIEELQNCAEYDGWNALYTRLRNIKFVRAGSIPSDYVSDVRDAVQGMRDKVKDIIKKSLPVIVNCTQEQYLEDMCAQAPLVRALCGCVELYEKKFAELKEKDGLADFNDILHLALRLLVTPADGGKIEKTPLALELSQNYKEILVDEYQDTNLAQDMLFTALSRDGQNLFFVGDVKQSIYRFRQAMPEIFLNRRDGMTEFDGTTYPGKINLGKNFRSRKGVTDAVNYAFCRLMSKQAGEIDYSGGEELICGADYPEHDGADVSLRVLDITENTEMSQDAYEAEYTAEMIKEMIASGLTVKDGSGERPARYGDFCVLMRSVKGHSSAFVEAFTKNGVPAYADMDGSLFGSREMSLAISLLRVISNPVRDVPLLAVMLSPVFGFTPDDIAILRLSQPQASIYACTSYAAENGNEKCADFLNFLEKMRTLSVTLCASDLVRRIFEETSLVALAGAMPDGAQRRANLLMLLDIANRFDSLGGGGISSFVRFAERAGSIETTSADAIDSGADVVRIMSIHKSKGLEFPVCIIAGLSRNFNNSDLRDSVVIAKHTGIALLGRNSAAAGNYKTLAHVSAGLELKAASRSEELRVLYVAMTRAKERLVFITSLKKPREKIMRLAADGGNGVKLTPFTVNGAQSASEWVLSAFMCHPDFQSAFQLPPDISPRSLPAGFKLDVRVEKLAEQEERTQKLLPPRKPDVKLLSIIKERLSYSYPYGPLETASALRTASTIGDDPEGDFFAASRPSFLDSTGLNSAEKGIAVHRFMQLCDFSNSDVQSQIEQLVKQGNFTDQEAASLPSAQLEAFLASPLCAEMKCAKEIFREKKFAMLVPVTQLYPELDSSFADERVMLRGMIDCVFVGDSGAVIVDYKTDRGVTAGQLAEKHGAQLEIYAAAAESCFGLKVSRKVIYSFSLGKTVEV